MLLWHGDHAEATHRQVNLSSVQEEADTKLILLSLDATSFGATATRICSLDTDVLVLAMRRYLNLRQDVSQDTFCDRNSPEMWSHTTPTHLQCPWSQQSHTTLPGFHALPELASLVNLLARER